MSTLQTFPRHNPMRALEFGSFEPPMPKPRVMRDLYREQTTQLLPNAARQIEQISRDAQPSWTQSIQVGYVESERATRSLHTRISLTAIELPESCLLMFSQSLGLINKIVVSDAMNAHYSTSVIENIGDVFATPGRLFLGRTYVVVQEHELHSCETVQTLVELVKKVAIVILFPVSIVSTLIGLGLKWAIHEWDKTLEKKYELPTLINARTEENFNGKLPQNPWTPNCVNSQEKSSWGELYDVEPILGQACDIAPLLEMKNLLRSLKVDGFDYEKFKIVEERPHYLHGTYRVTIESGMLKGVYIDDIDIYYNEERGQFDIRSASRIGFRDAIHLDFSLQGANKKRIEAIRAAWAGRTP